MLSQKPRFDERRSSRAAMNNGYAFNMADLLIAVQMPLRAKIWRSAGPASNEDFSLKE
jgi:hypothetical protein